MVSWNRMWLQLAAVILYFGTRPICSDPLMLVLRLQPIHFSNPEYYQHISSSNWHSNGHMFLGGFMQSFTWFTWRLVLRVVFSGVSNAIHVSIQDLLMMGFMLGTVPIKILKSLQRNWNVLMCWFRLFGLFYQTQPYYFTLKPRAEISIGSIC